MGDKLAVILSITLGVGCVIAWLTHVIVCISDDRWGFLIAGAMFFPVAIIHGVGLWFGAWQIELKTFARLRMCP